LGAPKIAKYLAELTDHLCERLKAGNYAIVSSRLAGEKSQIVCIRHKAGMSPMALYAHLKERNIVTAPRSDRLRIAPHAYNLPEEIDALVAALP
jgi:selenocysteine lyase/cysteine desulfurase